MAIQSAIGTFVCVFLLVWAVGQGWVDRAPE